ncbi:MAG: hypothetical protein JWQ89_2309, partial [Devosia sp.]|nr:hypothetical protein [Devosia sp.]
IRSFVASIESLGAELEEGRTEWAKWALQQADAIDPTKNGTLRASMATLRQKSDGSN